MRLNSPLLIIGLTSLLLSACGSQLTVKGQFPSPLASPMPLNAAAFYSPELLSHSYVENSDDRDKWTIQTGPAQEEFFEALLPSLFAQWAGQSADPDSPEFKLPGVDIVVKPNLSDFQYTLPRESRSKIFEVWMKYNMQLFQGDGTLLADWFVTAYGKTPSGFMQSDEAAMNEAIVVALRDLGANLTLNFSRVPELKDWMAKRQSPASANSTTSTNSTISTTATVQHSDREAQNEHDQAKQEQENDKH